MKMLKFIAGFSDITVKKLSLEELGEGINRVEIQVEIEGYLGELSVTKLEGRE